MTDGAPNLCDSRDRPAFANTPGTSYCANLSRYYRRCAGILIAEAFGELGCDTLFRKQSVGQRVRLSAHAAPGGDLVGQPSQVFDDYDAQGNRHPPQFPDRQRLDLLVG
ncbi:hypothetical protein [Shinella sp.]|uniref:hypothetical protein n=1 Tax=Shinella sp. TaxID=1870904 RepID=UPI003F7308E6